MAEPSDPTRTSGPPAEPQTAADLTRSHDRDPVTATADPATGQPRGEPLEVLPGFDIIREIGSGGMGVVYEARQTRLNRKVALKVLRGRGEVKDVVRFLAEAEAVAAIRHPNVVQVYETNSDAGRPYMVLELLTGGTLQDRLRAGRLDPRDAAALVAELAGAVQAAHELGIVHRDLKPSNVLFAVGSGQSAVDSNDKTDTSSLPTAHCPLSTLSPKVTDFGLAKRAGGVDLTRTQAVMGTPAYMAPEQAKGDTKFVGPAADVWALGAILYECLTGKRPFDAEETFAILRKVVEEPPPRPRDHVPGLPRDLELIALKCLEKSPADRYPSAAALAEDLERFLAGKPVSVRPAGPTERFVKWVRRNPVVAGFTAALVLVAVAGFAGVTWALWQTEKREKELALANGELMRTNDDLTTARNTQEKLNHVLKNAQAGLFKQAGELIEANEAAAARGYLSDVALAHQLWKANDLAGMRAALDRCPPDRRKWEWHYLKGLSHPERDLYITDSPPMAVAYSPDGKWLAYVTITGTLTVRDLARDKGGHTIPGGGDGDLNRLTAIAFHPKGGELAYALNGRVRVVDLATGKWKELKDPAQPDGNPGNRNGSPTIAVGYTPAGRLLAAAHARGGKPGERTFVIRDAATAEPVSTLAGYAEPEGVFAEVTSAAFSPDGTKFAAAAVDSGIRVRGKDEPEKHVPFRPTAAVWEVASGKRVAAAECGSTLFGGVAFSPDSLTLGYGQNKRVGTTPARAGSDSGWGVYSGHAGEVLAVAFGHDGLVWSGGEDKFVRAHDRASGAERLVLRGCSRGVLRLAVSPDGREVAAACGDVLAPGGAVYRFDVATERADTWRDRAAPGHVSLVAALAPDGSRFAACDFPPFDDRPETARFVTRDLAGGKEVAVTPAGQWLRGAIAPDGRVFVTEHEKPTDRAEQIRVIEPDGKPGPVIKMPDDPERHPLHTAVVGCAPDGRVLAAVTADRGEKVKLRARLHTWDANTREPRASGEADLSELAPANARFPGLFPLAVAFDREGRRAAAAFAANWEAEGQARFESRGAVVVWDLASGKELFRKYAADPLHAVAFDARGRVAAAGGSSVAGVVFGWDVDTKAEFLRLRGHTRPILSLAFGPDDRLATGGGDRVVKVWDLQSKREVLTLDGFPREVAHLAFTTGGKNLVAATGIDMLAAMGATGLPTDWPPAEVRIFRGPK